MDNENEPIQPENTAVYAMRVIGEIDAFIRKKYGMGIVITHDDGVALRVGDNNKIKATFTVTAV